VTPSRWRDVNQLFHDLLERPAAEREQRLAEIESGDVEIAREVRSLLASHERAGGFMEAPVWTADPGLLDEPSPLIGRQIGSYRIVEEIGRGGMGVVYAAEDQRLGRMVAIKALPPEYTRDPARRARLTREARAAAALSHPAIATIYTLDETADGLYIVGELVRGRTLRQELADGALPSSRLVPTLLDIAGALDAAHRLGIVHRDLKPENVMRREDGQIKVLDFGLARWELSPDTPSMTRLTQDGVALGTPGYMAPEQLGGGAVDARADLFSFGVVAWELATAIHPFGADPALALSKMAAIMEGRAILPGRALPGLERIALRCLRASPGDRYESAAALSEELRSLVPSAGYPATIAPTLGAPALWWWQFHQTSLAIVDAATPVLALLIRRSIGPPYGRWIFLGVLALATIAVTLRLNLLFTSRVHASRLAAHRSQLFPWIAVAEGALAAVLLGSALHLGADADITAAPLLTIALVLVASLAIIEPATTSGAGLVPDRDEMSGAKSPS
jgi:Protein kinase domain